MKSVIFTFVLTFATGFFADAQSLSGTKWTILCFEDLQSGNISCLDEVIMGNLQFDSDSTYSGKICNAYYGKYHCSGNDRLRMDWPGTTKENCFKISDFESQLFRLFTKAESFALKSDTLFIVTSDNHKLTFKKK